MNHFLNRHRNETIGMKEIMHKIKVQSFKSKQDSTTDIIYIDQRL